MESSSMISGIATYSEMMAVDAARDLDAQIEHCPDWKMRDLVEHIGRVQWFWSELIERRVTDRAQMNDVPYPEDRGEPLAWFRKQSARLVQGLRTMDDDEVLWTWWEPMQNAFFAKRRQLNEVIVHGWDARNAVGDPRPIDSAQAVVGLDEFLEVMQELHEDQPVPPPVTLKATDVAWSGTLALGDRTLEQTSAKPLVLEGTASDLLLSLWGRRPVTDPAIAAALDAIDKT
jgi:uncharacterized protein (TIGR03083 family)